MIKKFNFGNEEYNKHLSTLGKDTEYVVTRASSNDFSVKILATGEVPLCYVFAQRNHINKRDFSSTFYLVNSELQSEEELHIKGNNE